MKTPLKTILTLSNLISALRAVMTIPIVILLLRHDNTTAFFWCLAAAVTDWLDGFVARRTDTVSEWGMIIDPIADKILVGAVMLVMFAQQIIPTWFAWTIISRDVIILACGWWLKRRHQLVLPSLMSGKIAVTTIAASGILALLVTSNHGAVQLLMILATITMAVSLWQYGKRMYGILR
ncbi:MAG: CDP-alcohol phosphatidyltransferase family protein [Candidatus Kapabacteria bacterium]|nr:CDP-alcohol phosphatidyltransferase family protein [Candidatus Kapabacteria bacterium]